MARFNCTKALAIKQSCLLVVSCSTDASVQAHVVVQSVKQLELREAADEA